MGKKNLWLEYGPKHVEKMHKVIETYKNCLDNGKTERECIRVTRQMAKDAGYKPLSEYIETGKLVSGDKVYVEYNEKTAILYHIGEESLEKGMNILGAHVDSPRLDIKQNPLYENDEFAYLDTHYYGGIKKYQWVATQLALHGVICKKDGTRVDVCIGEKPEDPVFAITDLLPHLAQEQMEKKGAKLVEGEKLDLLIGNIPIEEDDKASVKANILNLLKETYGVEEDDFISAELEVVPAGKARDLGLDRSMVISYGQDDRICAFTSLMAILDMDTPKRTSCCLLVDKEEIGSYGASGMQSRFFENMTAEILALTGLDSAISLRRCLQNSKMLSSDVNAAYDPMFGDVFEKKNTSYLGHGICFTKYTGSRGKSGSSDANPEYIAKLRKIMEDNDVRFQTGELGKVDIGGGGTIAWIMANYGMEVIDSGLAILCMHAPMEIASKLDIYEAVRGYKAFLTDME